MSLEKNLEKIIAERAKKEEERKAIKLEESIATLDERISLGRHFLSELEKSDQEALEVAKTGLKTRSDVSLQERKIQEEFESLSEIKEYADFFTEKGVSSVEDLQRIEALSNDEIKKQGIDEELLAIAKTEDIARPRELKKSYRENLPKVRGASQARGLAKKQARGFISEQTQTDEVEKPKIEEGKSAPVYTSLATELAEYLKKLEAERDTLHVQTPEEQRKLIAKRTKEEEIGMAIEEIKKRHDRALGYRDAYIKNNPGAIEIPNYIEDLPLMISSEDFKDAEQYGPDMVKETLQKAIRERVKDLLVKQAKTEGIPDMEVALQTIQGLPERWTAITSDLANLKAKRDSIDGAIDMSKLSVPHDLKDGDLGLEEILDAIVKKQTDLIKETIEKEESAIFKPFGNLQPLGKLFRINHNDMNDRVQNVSEHEVYQTQYTDPTWIQLLIKSQDAYYDRIKKEVANRTKNFNTEVIYLGAVDRKELMITMDGRTCERFDTRTLEDVSDVLKRRKRQGEQTLNDTIPQQIVDKIEVAWAKGKERAFTDYFLVGKAETKEKEIREFRAWRSFKAINVEEVLRSAYTELSDVLDENVQIGKNWQDFRFNVALRKGKEFDDIDIARKALSIKKREVQKVKSEEGAKWFNSNKRAAVKKAVEELDEEHIKLQKLENDSLAKRKELIDNHSKALRNIIKSFWERSISSDSTSYYPDLAQRILSAIFGNDNDITARELLKRIEQSFEIPLNEQEALKQKRKNRQDVEDAEKRYQQNKYNNHNYITTSQIWPTRF